MWVRSWKSAIVVSALFAGGPLYAADIEVPCYSLFGPFLSSAIVQANATGESIGLEAGCRYEFSAAHSNDTALPAITGNVRIEGRNAIVARAAGAVHFRLFWVDAGGSLTLTNLTLVGGHAPDGAKGSAPDLDDSAGDGGDGQHGGAIVNHGTVVLDRVRLIQNRAGAGGQGGRCAEGLHEALLRTANAGAGGVGGRGGAVWNNGALTIRNQSVVGANASGNGGKGGDCENVENSIDTGPGAQAGGGGAIWSEPMSWTTILRSTLTHNDAGDGGDGGTGTDGGSGAGARGGSGGAIMSLGGLIIEDSTIEYGTAGSGGSGGWDDGVYKKNINLPGAAGNGGGIAAEGGEVTIRRTTIFQNMGGAGGTAIALGDGFHGLSGVGGGMYLSIDASIENSTFARNVASEARCANGGDGGALFVADGVVDLLNVTLTGNNPGNVSCADLDPGVAGEVGGIVALGLVRLQNTILDGAIFHPFGGIERNPLLCSGNVIDSTSGFNHAWQSLTGLSGCPSTFVLSRNPALQPMTESPPEGRDPALGPQPARLGTSSQAIDAGHNASCLSTDQIGTPRPLGPNCDVGAFEAIPFFLSHPQAQTVNDGDSVTMSVTLWDHGLAPDVKWQFSSNGSNWIDLTAPVAAALSGDHYTSSYTIAGVDRSHAGHYRAFGTSLVAPEAAAASDSARLTVQWGPVITLNLPVSIIANIGEEFALPFNYEASPAVETVQWEISKDDGVNWQDLIPAFAGSTGQDFYFTYVATAEMFNASTPWRYRVRLTGGYDGRPEVTSNVAVVTVTDDPTLPRFVGGFQHGMPWPEGVWRALYIQVTGNPPPAISWQSSIDGGDWNTLVNDRTETSYNTSPTEYQDGRAQLGMLAKGFKDGWKVRAVLNGQVYSDSIDIRVSVPTSMEVDCPQFVLPDEVYSCTATVIPQPQFGPRERLPSGYVVWNGAPASVSPGLCSRPCCELDETGQCTLSFRNDQASGESISIEAYYPFFETGLTAHPRDLSSGLAVQITVAACAEPIVTDAPAAFQLETESGECFGRMPDLRSQIVAPERGCAVTIEQTPPAGTEMSLGTHPVVFNVTSDAGSDVWNLSLTVVDGSTPVMTISGDNPATLACGETWNDPGAAVTTVCGTPVPAFADGVVDSSTPGRYTVTYRSTDPDHAGITATRQVDVVDDQPPSISLIGPAALTAECGEYIDEGATATDGCSGPIEPVLTILNNANDPVGAVDGPGVYTFRYTASDAAGNQASVSRTVTMTDDTGPLFDPIGPTLQYECNTTLLLPARSAIDACEGEIAAVIVENDVDITTPGSYSALYRATDSSGNATDQTQPVDVTDTVKPVITLSGDAEMTIECGTAYVEPGVIVTDSCDTTAEALVTGAVGSDTPGTYTLTYQVTDASGNESDPITRTVHVVDSIDPVVTLAGDASVTIECHATFDDPGASAVDACAGTLVIVTSGNVDLDVPGTYTRRYTAVDPSGNVSFAERTIIVEDTTKPVITLAGLSTMTVECQDAFDDPGATASDACDPSLTVVVTGSVDPDTPGTYTLKYNTTDDAGLAADEVTRTVIVVDTTGPAIALLGDASMTIECHTSFSDPGASATDSCEGARPVIVTGSVDVNAPGTYTLHYNATDSNGNAADEVTRTVIVSDTTKPAITLDGDAAMTIECGSNFTDPGATSSDSCGGSLPVTVTGSVDANTPGIYKLTYTSADSAENEAVPVERIVNVTDTTDPVITLLGDDPMVVESHAAFVDPGATAADTCAGTLAATPSGTVDTTTPGAHTITYTATDPGGNEATATRTVNVVDTTAPSITSCAIPVTGSAGAACGIPVPDFTVNAAATDASGSITWTQTPAAGTPVSVGVHEITLTAHDPGQNSSSCTTTFTVVDDIAPALSCPTSLDAVAWESGCTVAVHYSATATDGCGATTLSFSHPSGSLFDEGTTNVTVTATDLAGNILTCSFPVHVRAPQSAIRLPAVTAQYGDPATLRAIITDDVTGGPVAGGSVAFTENGLALGGANVSGGSVSLTTDLGGLPPSVRTLGATYLSDACMRPSGAQSTLTITREDATLSYTGALFFGTGELETEIVLTAQMTQAADGAESDPAKGALLFRISPETGGSGVEQVISASVDTDGIARATAVLGRGDWRVVAAFDDAASFYDGPDTAPVDIRVGSKKRRGARK